MSTIDDSDKEIEQSREALEQDARGLWQSLKSFLFGLLDLRADTDRANTIEAIKNDTIDVQIINKDKARLREWLKFKLKTDTLVVK